MLFWRAISNSIALKPKHFFSSRMKAEDKTNAEVEEFYYWIQPDKTVYIYIYIYPNCAYFVDAKFGTPPQKNRSKYENDNIIRSCNLKEIPYKSNIFSYPPLEKSFYYKNVNIIRRQQNMHNQGMYIYIYIYIIVCRIAPSRKSENL